MAIQVRPLGDRVIVKALPKEEKTIAFSIVNLFTRSDWSYELSGANVFDNVKWFNKERTEQNLTMLFLVMLLTAKTAKVEEVRKLYKTICSAKLKAAYKCDLFIKPFQPVEKATSVKKTVAKKADAKDTPAKNGATKKVDSQKTAEKKPVAKKTEKKK